MYLARLYPPDAGFVCNRAELKIHGPSDVIFKLFDDRPRDIDVKARKLAAVIPESIGRGFLPDTDDNAAFIFDYIKGTNVM
jgi:hypothetical protein